MVHTIGFQTLYVYLFINHERRELIHFNVTASLTAAWIWRQAIEVTAWGDQPRYLIHARDNVYWADFGSKLVGVGSADIQTPYRAPLANSVAERVVRTLRQDCLDHVIVLNERHLLALLTEFVYYYNHDRPHRAIELETPLPSPPIRMARSSVDRSWEAFTTSMRGRQHERCTSAALQPEDEIHASVASSIEADKLIDN